MTAEQYIRIGLGVFALWIVVGAWVVAAHDIDRISGAAGVFATALAAAWGWPLIMFVGAIFCGILGCIDLARKVKHRGN